MTEHLSEKREDPLHEPDQTNNKSEADFDQILSEIENSIDDEGGKAAKDDSGGEGQEDVDQFSNENPEDVTSKNEFGESISDESISDDELWDEGGDLDEIPLFEDLEQEAEPQQQTSPKPEDDYSGPEAKEKPIGAEAEDAIGKVEPESKDTEEASKNPLLSKFAQLISYFPWIITALSSIFLVAGIVTLWTMINHSIEDKEIINKALDSATPTVSSNINKSPVGVAPIEGPESITQVPSGFETITLSPFLIPAHRAGELIFIKLQIELVVEDMTTKHRLLKKEAWVRDIIYRELKGITIENGVRGNFLMQYRKPLLKRLNKEMAPLKVEDIRLMAFILK